MNMYIDFNESKKKKKEKDSNSSVDRRTLIVQRIGVFKVL